MWTGLGHPKIIYNDAAEHLLECTRSATHAVSSAKDVPTDWLETAASGPEKRTTLARNCTDRSSFRNVTSATTTSSYEAAGERMQ